MIRQHYLGCAQLAFYNLGLVHEAMALPDLAIQDHQNALRLNPGFKVARDRIQLLVAKRTP